MFEIQDSTSSKKQKWIKKWEPHKHCSVCGVAIAMEKEEFCSSKCSGEYNEWKQEQERKSKRNNIFMFIMFGVLIVMMLILPMLQSM